MINDETMPLIPLRGLTIYPGMVVHFDIGREKSILALERAMMLNQTVFLTTQKSAETYLPTEEDLYRIATANEPLNEDSPLWHKDSFLISPHNSFIGEGNPDRLANTIFHNLRSIQ